MLDSIADGTITLFYGYGSNECATTLLPTPLALREELPADLPGDASRYFDKIVAASHRMGQLIEDLLNLSRVSRGGGPRGR